MHGHPFDHGDIARRQIPPFHFGNGPVQDPTSITIQSSSSISISSSSSSSSSSSISISSSSDTSMSLSTVSLTSPISSSSSVSSTSSSPSPTPLVAHSTPPPTPTPTLSSSTSVFTSSSSGNVTTITAIVPASASASSDAAATVPKSFLQNKPLAAGVFTVISIIGVVILIVIGTMWIRSASRRRLNREALDASAFDPAAIVRGDNEKVSLEKLRRVNSTGSSGFSHTAGQAGVGRGGGYPASPVTQLAPQNYWQTSPYQGQPPEGPNYDSRYPTYLPPRSLDLVYNPARTAPPPQVNIIAPTPNTTSHFGDETSPIRPSSQNVPPTLQRGSLLNSPPVSPSGPGENAAGHTRGSSSYSRTLDMQEMPVAPPLPAKFGSDENEDEDGEAYGGIGSDHGHEIPRSLKVANQ